MQYISYHKSPLGGIMLASDEIGLCGLWFEGQKYFARCLSSEHIKKETDVIKAAKCWLDVYFGGREPDFAVPLHFIGTEFQQEVWQILCTIPYGQTMTYGEIADLIAHEKGLAHMAAQAVGNAVSRNAISIIVPCHRVVGAGGRLTGYAGGLDRKMKLLSLERTNAAL